MKQPYWYEQGFYKRLDLRLMYMNLKKIELKSHMIVFFSLLVFISSFIILFYLLHTVIVSLLISILMASLPYLVTNLMMEDTQVKIGQEVTKLISAMARWSLIKDDIFYCFEKSLHYVDPPLKNFIESFLIKVEYSGQVDSAFEELINRSKNESYLNLMLNIRQIELSKGDLPYLLSRLEEEAYKIRGEQMRRTSDTAIDRTIIYLASLLTIVIASLLLIFNDRFQHFYLKTALGRYLIVLFIALYFIGFIFSRRINTFNY